MTDVLSLQDVVARWLEDMVFNGRGPRTVRSHADNLRRFGRWLTQRGLNWRDLGRRDMAEFMRTVATKSFSLRANLGCSMRMFYEYAVLFEYVDSSPAVIIKTPIRPRPVPRALSRAQIRRLLAYLAEQDGRHARRDECMIITALYTGGRAGEVCALVWDDIDIAGESVTIRNGKTGGRTVALHPALADLLTQWRELQACEIKLRGDTPIFALDEQGLKGIKGTRLGKICRQVGSKLGFTIQAHALRHSAATHAIRAGAGLWNVSRMLGHSDTSTTSRTYISTDPSDSVAAIKALPSLNEW